MTQYGNPAFGILDARRAGGGTVVREPAPAVRNPAYGILDARRVTRGGEVRRPVLPQERLILASNGAKQLAAKRNVQLADVKGTGKHGLIVLADVKRYLKSRG